MNANSELVRTGVMSMDCAAAGGPAPAFVRSGRIAAEIGLGEPGGGGAEAVPEEPAAEGQAELQQLARAQERLLAAVERLRRQMERDGVLHPVSPEFRDVIAARERLLALLPGKAG